MPFCSFGEIHHLIPSDGWCDVHVGNDVFSGAWKGEYLQLYSTKSKDVLPHGCKCTLTVGMGRSVDMYLEQDDGSIGESFDQNWFNNTLVRLGTYYRIIETFHCVHNDKYVFIKC